MTITQGSIINTVKCGSLKVEEITSATNVLVEFLSTGSVKEGYFPSVCGVDYLGESEFGTTGEHKHLHGMWFNLLNRCYNPNQRSYKYNGAK